MTLWHILLFQLLSVVLLEMVGHRLTKRFGTRALVWSLALLAASCFALGSLFVSSCKGWGFFLCCLGWPLLVLSVPMTAIVIVMGMQLRPRAWLAVALLVLSIAWIVQ